MSVLKYLIKHLCNYRSINNTHSARKINQAVNSTLSNAKTTFSSWISNLKGPQDGNELAKDVVISMKSCENSENSE